MTRVTSDVDVLADLFTSGVVTVFGDVFTLAGIMASFSLPISQYPEISPPTVTITTAYPGASADTIAQTVAAPIEQQLSGTEGMIYYVSSASQDGSLTITCTFEIGTDSTAPWCS